MKLGLLNLVLDNGVAIDQRLERTIFARQYFIES